MFDNHITALREDYIKLIEACSYAECILEAYLYTQDSNKEELENVLQKLKRTLKEM